MLSSKQTLSERPTAMASSDGEKKGHHIHFAKEAIKATPTVSSESEMNERIQAQRAKLRAELAAANKNVLQSDQTGHEEDHDLDHSHAHGVHKERRLRALSTTISVCHLLSFLVLLY